MPETTWNFWNLIKFNEYEPEGDGGNLMLLMRKDQCMHCEEPGCLIACPSDGAIVQYANGIVDFQQDECIGCGYCITGCPFNIPKMSPKSQKVFKCTLCVDRVSEGLEPACIKACPTGCLHFGTKDEMKGLGETRAKQLREQSGFAHAGVYDPAGVGGTHVLYVLHDATNPEAYGGLPRNPHVPWTVWLWKKPLKWIGNLAMAGGLIGVFVHYLRFGPKTIEEDHGRSEPGRKAMRDESHVLPNGRVQRYTFRERLMHWVAGLSYLYLLITGLAFWSPWLFGLTAITGGPTISRLLHPWVGVIFFLGTVLDVWPLERSDARIAARQGVVALDQALHPQRGQPGSRRGAVQPRPEAPLLGFLLVRTRAAAHRHRPLDPRVDSVEPAIPAADRRDRAPYRRVADDRPVHHSRLHGNGGRAGRLLVDRSRRRVAHLGSTVPSRLVRAGRPPVPEQE